MIEPMQKNIYIQWAKQKAKEIDLVYRAYAAPREERFMYEDKVKLLREMQTVFPELATKEIEALWRPYFYDAILNSKDPQIESLKHNKKKHITWNDTTLIADQLSKFIIDRYNSSNTLDKLVCVMIYTPEDIIEFSKQIGCNLTCFSNKATTIGSVLKSAIEYINSNFDRFGISIDNMICDTKSNGSDTDRPKIFCIKIKLANIRPELCNSKIGSASEQIDELEKTGLENDIEKNIIEEHNMETNISRYSVTRESTKSQYTRFKEILKDIQPNETYTCTLTQFRDIMCYKDKYTTNSKLCARIKLLVGMYNSDTSNENRVVLNSFNTKDSGNINIGIYSIKNVELEEVAENYTYIVELTYTFRNIFKKPYASISITDTFVGECDNTVIDSIERHAKQIIDNKIWCKGSKNITYSYNILSKKPI